jgi:hypothetical protein
MYTHFLKAPSCLRVLIQCGNLHSIRSPPLPDRAANLLPINCYYMTVVALSIFHHLSPSWEQLEAGLTRA